MLSIIALAAWVQSHSDVAYWESRAHRLGDAQSYRGLADAYVQAEKYDQASSAFSRASRLFAKLGDLDAAEVLEGQSKRYETIIDLYWEQPVDAQSARRLDTGAKFEPAVGCYTGVNIEREDMTRDPARFDKILRKPQADFFIYRSYGKPFPSSLGRQLKALHAGLQIAFEPSSLGPVQDDAYLQKFALDAKRSGIPVFLRFASEMNGSWTASAYGADPHLYREKFRLVASVMHRDAPNVAMVWCPNEIPEANIPNYFPGDDAVDWVGVNFYSVFYFEGDRSRPAAWRNPVDALDNIYTLYAAKHPIMIGEWAATHDSVVDGVERPEFAQEKIGQLYGALPLRYPRVKAVHWLSMNTMKYADGPRKLNDFSLMSSPDVAGKYVEMTASPYFLDHMDVDSSPSSPIQFLPIEDGMHVPAGARIAAYIRTYEGSPKVAIEEEGFYVTFYKEPSAFRYTIKGSGKRLLSIDLYDSKGRTAAKKKISIIVDAQNPLGSTL